MIDYVGTPPFLRLAIRVAMETMLFHIAQTGLIFRNFFRIYEPREQFVAHEKLS